MTRDENNGQKPRGGPGPRRDTSPRTVKRAPAKAAAPADDEAKTDRQRIAKLMARVGLCSRRDAETWIVDGRVEVNGVVLTSPALDVGPDDKVLVDGIPLPAAEKTRLFLFHKPGGLITSDHDPEGRETVADYLRAHWPDGPRVVTIGRLDYNTEGLLLLTNDGGLARILELPATGWVRRYRVRAKGETNQPALDKLLHGVTIDGIEYAGIEAKLDRIQGANCWLTMGLREGKNREVKRVLEHIGLDVNRLIRLSFGPFQLLDLPEGHVEEVKTRILRDQLGPTLAAEAGVDFNEPETAPIVPAPKATLRDPARGARDDRAAKPARKVEERSAAPRSRNFRDRDLVDDVVAPEKRERPVAGPRRHVSTLRADKAVATRTGPRQRLERTDTLDRHNRNVKVERLVSSAPAPTEGRRARPERRERPETSERQERSSAPIRRERSDPGERRERSTTPERRERSNTPERRERSATPERRDRPSTGDRRERPASASTAFPKEGRGSQSAQGKRERVARSGGGPREERPARTERSFASERPARSDSRSPRSRDDAPARESRPPRRDATEAPRARTPGAKPFRSKPSSSGRPATGRSAEARHSTDRPQRNRSSDEKPTGGRLRVETKAFQARDKSQPRGASVKAPRSGGAKSFGDRPARGKPDGGKPARGRPSSGGGDKRGAPKGAPRGRPTGGSRPPRAPRG
jgi:23S rRNA pseudouridine2605 synthase